MQRPLSKREKKDFSALSLSLHKKLHGKLSVVSKYPLITREDWSMMYTPGVGAVSNHIARNPKAAREYTIKKNTVAVISDGSAVLGLGNVGPLAALPVMEGKCAILKEMAGIDGFPIVLDTQNTDEIVRTITYIAPVFGGINLEDISAPRCFEIEERLKQRLKIPLMHDDQHGTAIVVLAALMNAAKVVEKPLTRLRIVVVGAGAAGRAITLLLLRAGIKNIIVCDSAGVIYRGRRGLAPYKQELAKMTNSEELRGMLADVITGKDVVIGVSGPGTITQAHIEKMAENPIVFALANPIPEIKPEDAKRAGAAVVGTGRSDYPNQINNALAFPGIFRGALDREVEEITDEIKLSAAKKIAALVKKPTAENIVPSIMDKTVVKAVARVVR